ncbi:hypothetical protein STRAU_4517 [Streptomyces aurantiacus JA 4570]|uniref:HTH cro/C1-type domain-containing protein n=1 Tax=Streptomyces aurantiacus JA 4570 TaxID=1286094 RepID=S3ZI91_9ACTN|nr:hypothetical protein STRAU_4517 [Streptomyces aurantiacus JA 4570]
MGTRAGAWQPLPDRLPPEVRHFVGQLRRLKDHTGLSLVALGARTAYSKSSWQRYLNAQQPPPRDAVLALCRIAGADGARLAAGWELAVRAWPRAGEPSTAGAPASDTGPVAPVDPVGAVDLVEPVDPGAPVAPGVMSPPTRPTAATVTPVRRHPAPVRRPAPTWRLVACSALAVIALLLAGLLWILAQVVAERRGTGGEPPQAPGASVSEQLGTRRAPGTATE